MNVQNQEERPHLLHTYSIEDSSLEKVTNARVEHLTNSFTKRPCFCVTSDAGYSLSLVDMTGGNMEVAQTLLSPFCDALNTQDIALYRKMQEDIVSGTYESKLLNGVYKTEAPQP